MAGYLDPQAESIEFEYAIRCESDYLGKTIFKNFCLNVLQLTPKCLEIPLSKAGADSRDFVGDARIVWNNCNLDIEIKFSHLHSHKTAGDNWAFSRVIRTKKGQTKRQFDLLFCIGLLTRDPANPAYWQHRQTIQSKRGQKQLNLDAKPHQKTFLGLCNFFFLPYRKIRVNDFRPYLPTFKYKSYFQYYSSGQNPDQCKAVWQEAMHEAILAKRSLRKERHGSRRESEIRLAL
jgi:hypothetical protein